MSFPGMLVHQVTILRAGSLVDRRGTVQKDWSTATSRSARGWVTQEGQREARDQREAQVSNWALFLAAGDPIAGGDRVEWGDHTFEVDGPPHRAWTPRGEHHVEVQLVVVEG